MCDSWARIYEESEDAGLVCRHCGISRPTLPKWWKLYQAQDIDGQRVEAGRRMILLLPRQGLITRSLSGYRARSVVWEPGAYRANWNGSMTFLFPQRENPYGAIPGSDEAGVTVWQTKTHSGASTQKIETMFMKHTSIILLAALSKKRDAKGAGPGGRRLVRRKPDCSAIPSLFRAAVSAYRFMPITVSSMVSAVVMPLELAWKPRWVVIICTNSRAISTLDCSIL